MSRLCCKKETKKEYCVYVVSAGVYNPHNLISIGNVFGLGEQESESHIPTTTQEVKSNRFLLVNVLCAFTSNVELLHGGLHKPLSNPITDLNVTQFHRCRRDCLICYRNGMCSPNTDCRNLR